MSEALYVRRSLQHLSDELAELGHAACGDTKSVDDVTFVIVKVLSPTELTGVG